MFESEFEKPQHELFYENNIVCSFYTNTFEYLIKTRSVSWSKTDLYSISLAPQDSFFFFFPEHCKPFILTLPKSGSKIRVSKFMLGFVWGFWCFVCLGFFCENIFVQVWLPGPAERDGSVFQSIEVQTFTVCLLFPCWNCTDIDQHYILSSATVLLPFNVISWKQYKSVSCLVTDEAQTYYLWYSSDDLKNILHRIKKQLKYIVAWFDSLALLHFWAENDVWESSLFVFFKENVFCNQINIFKILF